MYILLTFKFDLLLKVDVKVGELKNDIACLFMNRFSPLSIPNNIYYIDNKKYLCNFNTFVLLLGPVRSLSCSQ